MLALHLDDRILAYRNEHFLIQLIRILLDINARYMILEKYLNLSESKSIVTEFGFFLKIVQAGYVDQILARFDITSAHSRNIPLDPGLKFSNTNKPKCDPAKTKLYHEVLGVIGWKCT